MCYVRKYCVSLVKIEALQYVLVCYRAKLYNKANGTLFRNCNRHNRQMMNYFGSCIYFSFCLKVRKKSIVFTCFNFRLNFV